MSVLIIFVINILTSIPFGFIWDIPKWGDVILVAAIFLVAGYIILNPGEVNIYNDYWYNNVANIVGTIVGLLMGERLRQRVWEGFGW